jgi:Rrf2 family protein
MFRLAYFSAMAEQQSLEDASRELESWESWNIRRCEKRQTMQLSQSVTYALQALLQLAESNEGVLITRGKLAANGKMPERFLLEILHSLVKRGLLRSTRGGGGGFALARTPEEISLLDVIEAVDGPIPVGMPANNSMAESLRTWLRKNLEQVVENAREHLAAMTLSRMVAAGAKHPSHGPDHVTGGNPTPSMPQVDWPMPVEPQQEI